MAVLTRVLAALAVVAVTAHVGLADISTTTETAAEAATTQAPGVSSTTKKPSIQTQVKNCVILAKALPGVLKLQWAAKTAQQTKNITAAEKTLEAQTQQAQSLAGVQAAFKALDTVEEQILANITSFAQLQINQTQAIVKNYTTLLNGRLQSKSTDEQSIHELRTSATDVMNSWVPLLSEIHQFAHVAFEGAVREQAELVSKKYENPVNDEVRVAVTNTGVQLLDVLVQEQNADTALLTSTQFNIFQNFFQESETVLIELLVAAKNGQ